MKNLWNKWCERVYEHNDRLGYVYYEEYWNPYYIFIPVLIFFLLFGVLIIKNNFIMSIIISISMSIIVSISLYINWKVYD